MSGARRAERFSLAIGAIGLLFVPWYALQDSVFGLSWIPNFATKEAGPALLQILLHGKGWLVPLVAILVAAAAMPFARVERRTRATTPKSRKRVSNRSPPRSRRHGTESAARHATVPLI